MTGTKTELQDCAAAPPGYAPGGVSEVPAHE
jgi:hypothetical protein